jgi:hypothetical protein
MVGLNAATVWSAACRWSGRGVGSFHRDWLAGSAWLSKQQDFLLAVRERPRTLHGKLSSQMLRRNRRRAGRRYGYPRRALSKSWVTIHTRCAICHLVGSNFLWSTKIPTSALLFRHVPSTVTVKWRRRAGMVALLFAEARPWLHGLRCRRCAYRPTEPAEPAVVGVVVSRPARPTILQTSPTMKQIGRLLQLLAFDTGQLIAMDPICTV